MNDQREVAPGTKPNAQIDDLDAKIIDALQRDPLATNRAIARSEGVAQSTIGLRLKELEDHRLVKLLAPVDLSKAGYDLFVLLGLRVNQRVIGRVTRDLANVPEVIYLHMVSGAFDVSAMLVCRDRHHLRYLLEKKVGQIPGVIASQADIALDVRRYEMWIRGELNQNLPKLEIAGIDSLDRSIIDTLHQDPRASLSEVARQEGVADGTVRQRLKRMQDTGLLQFKAITDPTSLGRRHLAWVGVEITPAKLDSAVANILKLPEIAFLTYTMGYKNLLTLVVVEDRQAFATFLTERFLRIPNVERAETTEILKVIKHDERWVMMTDQT